LDISVGLVPPMLHLAVKSLEINSYKMRLGFNGGFSFSVSAVTYIKSDIEICFMRILLCVYVWKLL
jgi:hypothetical protein